MNRGSIAALCFLLSFALTSCSTIFRSSKYAPKNELLYPNNADVEASEKYIDEIGVYIENCAYVIDATS
jgi:hypothetical protein